MRRASLTVLICAGLTGGCQAGSDEPRQSAPLDPFGDVRVHGDADSPLLTATFDYGDRYWALTPARYVVESVDGDPCLVLREHGAKQPVGVVWPTGTARRGRSIVSPDGSVYAVGDRVELAGAAVTAADVAGELADTMPCTTPSMIAVIPAPEDAAGETPS